MSLGHMERIRRELRHDRAKQAGGSTGLGRGIWYACVRASSDETSWREEADEPAALILAKVTHG